MTIQLPLSPPVGTTSVGSGDSWIYDTTTWNTLMFANNPAMSFVGKFEIRGAARKYKIDTKNAGGLEGATTTYRGYHVHSFTIKFYLWTDAQWQWWDTTLSKFFQYNGSKLQPILPVDISHPSLASVGIRSVICLDLGAVEVGDDLIGVSTCKFMEYIPPPIVNSTQSPSGALGGPVSTVAPGIVPSPAILAKEQQVAALQATAAGLGTAGGLP